MNKLLPIALFALILSSCGNNNSRPDTDKTLGTPQISSPVEANPVTTTQVSTDTNTVAPAIQATPAAVPAAVPTPVATGKVNPPHGQPGHRCDLQVGAPLDGAPAPAATAPVINTTPAIAPPAASPLPAGIASPKTNPAHGLPGHRCDLAVGAPLT